MTAQHSTLSDQTTQSDKTTPSDKTTSSDKTTPSEMTVFKEFSFEAAHLLPNVPPGHKCRRLHGHSFRAQVHVRGPVEAASGWVIDFADIAQAFAPLHDQLDHHYLNEIEGLENPTSENLARWLWQRLESQLAGLCQIVVRETCTSGCVYEGEG